MMLPQVRKEKMVPPSEKDRYCFLSNALAWISATYPKSLANSMIYARFDERITVVGAKELVAGSLSDKDFA
jgi:hypothetical protein